MNSRLDEMQAAILSRAAAVPAALDRARGGRSPRVYRRELAGAGVDVPPECDAGHVYHLFPVLLAAPRRAAGGAAGAHGIETLIHYPVPIPRQPALASESPAVCPVADRVCAEVLSLPLHPAACPRRWPIGVARAVHVAA